MYQVTAYSKWCNLLLVISLFSLEACQRVAENQNDVGVKKKHRPEEAANYNIQLGLEYLKQGNISRSKRKLLLALKQAPGSPEANAAMAYFMEKSGEVENATIYYQKAMAAAPGRGTQFNNYGAFLCRQGDYAQAETYFLKAVNDIQYINTAGAYENAGLCAMASKNDAKAEQFFMKAIGQDSSRTTSLYELVKVEVKHAEYDKALSNLQKYSEIVMQSRDILALAINVAHQAGKLELEANYRRSLDIFGVNDHDNSNNG